MGYKNIFAKYKHNILGMAAFVAWLWLFPLFGIIQSVIPGSHQSITNFNFFFLSSLILGFTAFTFLRHHPAVKRIIAFTAPSAAVITFITMLVIIFSPNESLSSWRLYPFIIFSVLPAILGIAVSFYFAYWGISIYYVPETMRGRYMGLMIAVASTIYGIIALIFYNLPLLAFTLSGAILIIPVCFTNNLVSFVGSKYHNLRRPNSLNLKSSSLATLRPWKSFWLPFSLVLICFYIVGWAAHDVIFSPIKADNMILHLLGQGFYALVCLVAACLLDRSREIEMTGIYGLILLGCTLLLMPLVLPYGLSSIPYILLEGSYGLIDLFLWVSLAYYCQYLRGDPGKYYAVGLLLNILFIVSGIIMMPLLNVRIEGITYSLFSLLSAATLFIGILPILYLRKVRVIANFNPDLTAGIENGFEKANLERHISEKGLTKKEKQILFLMLSGLNNADLSLQLKISRNTLKTHIRHIYEKCDVHNRSELLLKYAGYIKQVRI